MHDSAWKFCLLSVLPEFRPKFAGKLRHAAHTLSRLLLEGHAVQHLCSASTTFSLHILQIKAKLSLLTGRIPAYRQVFGDSEENYKCIRPSDLSASCCFFADGEALSLPSRTRPRQADLEGCEWQEWLHYYIKVSVSLWQLFKA